MSSNVSNISKSQILEPIKKTKEKKSKSNTVSKKTENISKHVFENKDTNSLKNNTLNKSFNEKDINKINPSASVKDDVEIKEESKSNQEDNYETFDIYKSNFTFNENMNIYNESTKKTPNNQVFEEETLISPNDEKENQGYSLKEIIETNKEDFNNFKKEEHQEIKSNKSLLMTPKKETENSFDDIEKQGVKGFKTASNNSEGISPKKAFAIGIIFLGLVATGAFLKFRRQTPPMQGKIKQLSSNLIKHKT